MMVRPKLDQTEILAAAAALHAERCGGLVGDPRASWVEPASGRDARGVGRLTREERAIDAPRLGHDVEERTGVRMQGTQQHFLGGAGLDDPAEVHDRHAVGHRPGQTQVVGHDQDADLHLVAELQEEVQDLSSHRGVETGHGLVSHDQLRIEDKCAGDHHPLTLATGQLMRIEHEEALGWSEPGAGERPGDELLLRLAVGSDMDPMDPKSLRNDLVDRLTGVERAGRVLEHHLDASAIALKVAPERLPFEEDLALSRTDQPHHGPRDRGLPTSGLAGEGEHLTSVDRQIHAVDGFRVCPLLAEDP
jgi:hypothetical protein